MSLCVVRFVVVVCLVGFFVCVFLFGLFWLVLFGWVFFCVCGGGFWFCGVGLFALTGTKLLSPLLRDGHETEMGRQSNKS